MSDFTPIPYASVVRPPVDRRRVALLGVLSCAAGLAAIVVPARAVLGLLDVPPGTTIRPMAEAALIFLGAAGGLLVAVPLGVRCVVAARRWWPGWVLGLVGCALGCSPWFVSSAVFDWVVAKQGFVLAP